MNSPDIDVVESALSGVGLNEVEVVVYKTSLSLGPRPASLIAKRAGLNRTHTYDVLSSLASKGLMREFIKNSVKHFSSCQPKELLQIIEKRESKLLEKKQQLLSALPVMEKLANPSSGQPIVKYFQGVDAIKKIFEQTLSQSEGKVYGFADAEYSASLSDDWREEYTRARVAKGVWYYGIIGAPPSRREDGQSDKELLRAFRVVPSITLPVEIIIFGSKVAILSTYDEKIGMIVDNTNVSDTLLSLHQAMWGVEEG